ncbi:MAG: NADH-quinone oxidoreductase subunit L [Gammaproteobacteria bacterium]|nr:NADH-quinone oxidoreductase subunit L [Gammaproteobacteria bacterium]
MEQLITVTPLLLIASAILTQVLSVKLGRRVAWLSVSAISIGFALTLVILGLEVAGLGGQHVSTSHAWGVLLTDPLSAIMSTLIAGISLIVHLYSVRYMAEEPGYARFFVLLDLMTASLLVMVAAGDLITLLIAWHAIGVLLYFLLGHDTRRQSTFRYAFWTFITYRIGDLALIVAAAILFHAYGTWSLTEIFAAIQSRPDATTFMGMPVAEATAVFLALAAFARSAQFLLHNWLPYTMDGPTPVSALMHAGIVNAGGFLVNRFAPVFVHASDVLHWLFVVGLITAVIGSVLMLTQNDIKKSLGYSTMGQMGFMIMECGVGAFSLAIYHLIAHGLFKGTLFLGAGGVINEARRDDGVPKDDLYTFVVERRPARRRPPWLMMAVITLVVPALVLVLAHWLVSQDVFQKQGAIVLLFFGWVTGAQLIFATYRMRSERSGQLLTLVLSSFTVVVVGYTLISHVFELFLYPDPGFRELIHQASNINVVWFDILIIFTTIVIVLGWLLTYYSEQNGKRARRRSGRVWLSFYALISREFYLADLYAWFTRMLLRTAECLNIWLRWA